MKHQTHQSLKISHHHNRINLTKHLIKLLKNRFKHLNSKITTYRGGNTTGGNGVLTLINTSQILLTTKTDNIFTNQHHKCQNDKWLTGTMVKDGRMQITILTIYLLTRSITLKISFTEKKFILLSGMSWGININHMIVE